MTKTFSGAIIGTNSMVNSVVLRTGLWRLIPTIEGHEDHIMEVGSFPLTGMPLPQEVRGRQTQLHSKDEDIQFNAKARLNTVDIAYICLSERPHICMGNAGMFSVAWLDALKRDGHGLIMYDTEGFVEGGGRYEADLYHFTTWKNGQMKPRGTFSVQQQKWIDEPKPIRSWQFRSAN